MARKQLKDLQIGNLFVWNCTYIYCVICLIKTGAYVLLYDCYDEDNPDLNNMPKLSVQFWSKDYFINVFEKSYYLSCGNK